MQPKSLRRIDGRHLAAVGVIVGAWLWIDGGTVRAVATEVRCIEESKYKYLYELFGGDRRKFADYFGIDPETRRLPEPEYCRAAMLSGPTGETGKNEFGDLVRMIAENRGWLAAIHLSSPGGSGFVWEPAYLIRKLRMKTVVAQKINGRIAYDPDFAPAPTARLVPRAYAAVCFLKDKVAPHSRASNTVSGITRPDPFRPTLEVNIDLPGSDIRGIDLPRSDPRLCQQRCTEDPGCHSWTFNGPPLTSGPVCWIKSAVPKPRDAGEGMVSGIVRPDPFKPSFEPGIDFRGNDYAKLDLPRPEPRLCQQQCQADARCRAWTYNGPGAYVLLTGWDRFRTVQRELPALAPPYGECASSCSFIHAGGVDRSGQVNVHRPSTAQDMTDFESRQAAGDGVRKFYEYMDTGASLVQIWETTPAATVRPAFASRFPRYLNDYLLTKCGRDAETLQRREQELLATADAHSPLELSDLYEQRREVEQCIAGEFERARLSAFDRTCGNGCDAKRLFDEMQREIHTTLDRK